MSIGEEPPFTVLKYSRPSPGSASGEVRHVWRR
jgi:hypothetical protein